MEISEHAHDRVGTILNDKYTLQRLIGSGGMATVYEASHRNGHRVAIKILHDDLAVRDDVRDRFLREGYVANKVEHPGAVRVLDDDISDDGSVFLVMELLVGATLDERCKRAGGLLPVREVCLLAHQLLEVLATAHAVGVVHRDIKPENLFLTDDGTLKVLDFGIARLLEGTERYSSTRTGTVIGTPAFMAPEQALGQWSEVDGQSDLWAVGATMFTLMSGSLVHDAQTMQEMMVRAGSTAARSLRSVAQHVPPPIADVVDAALAFRKTDRWVDAWTMAARLQEAYQASFGVAILAEASPLSPGASRSAPLSAHPRSMRPRSAAPIAGPVRTVSRIAPRSNPPLSTTIGLSREWARAPRRARIRALVLVFFALGSVVAGIVVASRKEPATTDVSPPPTPPPLIVPAPLPSSAPVEQAAPFPSTRADDTAPVQPSGAPSAEAKRALDGSTITDGAVSKAAVSTSPPRAPAPVSTVFVARVRPTPEHVPGATVPAASPITPSVPPSEVPPASPAPSVPDADGPSNPPAPAPSASAAPEPTYDPNFGL